MIDLKLILVYQLWLGEPSITPSHSWKTKSRRSSKDERACYCLELAKKSSSRLWHSPYPPTLWVYFQIPLKLCDELDAFCAKFWWGQVGNERKIYWKSWDKLIVSKKEGGMGFWDLRAFNLAMLAKQGWRMVQGNDLLLYQCFKARYFPRTNFLEAENHLIAHICGEVWWLHSLFFNPATVGGLVMEFQSMLWRISGSLIFPQTKSQIWSKKIGVSWWCVCWSIRSWIYGDMRILGLSFTWTKLMHSAKFRWAEDM